MSKEKMTMRNRMIVSVLAAATALLVGLVGAPTAGAAFGIAPGSYNAEFLDQAGEPYLQAGGHPHKIKTEFDLNSVPGPEKGLPIPDESPLKSVKVELPPGFMGNPQAVPACILSEGCRDENQVGKGVIGLNLFGQHLKVGSPIWSVKPPQGEPALFLMTVVFVQVWLKPKLRTNGDYGLDMVVDPVDMSLPITTIDVDFWGVPASPAHDMERGFPLFKACANGGQSPCPSAAPRRAFLSMPTDCQHGPYSIPLDIKSWLGHEDSESVITHDAGGNPSGVTECERVPFEPSIESKPTSGSAQSPTGLDFELEIPTDGLLNPDGIAESHLRKAVIRMPKGVSLNPSAGEGLGVCTPAQFAREDVETAPNEGCPNTAKVGSMTIETPLLEEPLSGSVFLGQPDDPRTTQSGSENPFDSMVNIYLVARLPKRGIFVKVPGRIDPSHETGQLVATFDDIPQVPFSRLKVHFREGQRSPLVTPPACGTYETVAELTPWSAKLPGETVVEESSFVVTNGVGGAPCPSGGAPPFNPTLQAGALNNNAGSFTPFYLRMSRGDAEQEITNFSADLPPGVLAKLAGIPKCSDAALAHAAANSGLEEKENPSCPAASQVGRATIGYGVGTILNYTPGKVYLAGPYKGTPVSIATVTSALIGPFDVGTVIVRSAFRVDPEDAQVHVDSKGSDPIPHILDGILLHLRDIRLYMDRPGFVHNPTSCDPMTVQALVTGSGADFANPADDVALPVARPFQASNCGLLGFVPTMSFRLKGGTHRGDYPALRVTVKARPGDANIRRAVVELPHSEFLAQNHIRTVCTRVQYAAERCPKDSIYGQVVAQTPVLDQPLRGNVYLRSSNNPLPDIVASLRGEINVDLVGRIDSVNGGIRTTFNGIPDAPLTKFVLRMQGGKKSLLVNSRNLCKRPSFAKSKLVAQNSKLLNRKVKLANGCAKKGR